MSIEAKERELVEEFSQLDDWMDKYEYIIDLGKDLPAMEEQYKTPENIIKGCQSTVWLHAEKQDGRVIFHAAADALIVKGIVAMLVRILSNEKPQDIIDAKLSFIAELGLQEHLSPTRSNGLVAMVKQMKMYAMGFKMAA
jgi:cysteine desulfuration protein SufE